VSAGLLVARDVTPRVEMEERLREAGAQVERERDLLKSVLFALPDGLIVYDRSGGLITMNNLAKEMLVYDDDAWKRPVTERVTRLVELSRPDGALLAWSEYPAIRALQGEEVRNEELFLHLPAHPEKDFWAMLSACPMAGSDHEILGAVLTMTDVTELHEARAGLQNANEELRRQANELREAKEGLEQRVLERTAELAVLLEQAAVTRGQLQALSRRLVEMQENERTYVANHLYNQAAQVLAAVRMQLAVLERRQANGEGDDSFTGMKAALDQTILALHDLAAELRPAGLQRATLANVLREYMTRFAAKHRLALRFDAEGTENLRVPSEVVTAVYRTIQEAAANIARHAHATEVNLSLSLAGDRLTVVLQDNGVGFNTPAAEVRGGVGLIAMRERIESVGGRIAIDGASPGTVVRIEAPVDSTRDKQ
jgi:signal transduction histidine kinase